MASVSGSKAFLNSEAAKVMRQELEDMISSPAYNTGAVANDKQLYIEKHLIYVSRFPYLSSQQYVRNLKIKSLI